MADPIDAETAFQRWLSPGPGVKNYPRAYTDWCAQAREKWEAGSAHARAWRERQKREGAK